MLHIRGCHHVSSLFFRLAVRTILAIAHRKVRFRAFRPNQVRCFCNPPVEQQRMECPCVSFGTLTCFSGQKGENDEAERSLPLWMSDGNQTPVAAQKGSAVPLRIPWTGIVCGVSLRAAVLSVPLQLWRGGPREVPSVCRRQIIWACSEGSQTPTRANCAWIWPQQAGLPHLPAPLGLRGVLRRDGGGPSVLMLFRRPSTGPDGRLVSALGIETRQKSSQKQTCCPLWSLTQQESI